MVHELDRGVEISEWMSSSCFRVWSLSVGNMGERSYSFRVATGSALPEWTMLQEE